MLRAERQFLVARHLVEASTRLAGEGGTPLPSGVAWSDLRGLADALPATHLLRLFSKFEAGLRSVWSAHLGRTTSPPMEVLINRLTAYLAIPADVEQGAHEVREARNGVVHVGEVALPFAWAEGHRKLRRFVSYLPLSW